MVTDHFMRACNIQKKNRESLREREEEINVDLKEQKRG